MADDVTVRSGEGSPEFVAWRLLDYIRRTDRQVGAASSKKELLDLYAECLYATKGLREYPGQ